MKMVKNIAIVACAASFMFANVSFHMGNNYSNLDTGPDIMTSYGATYSLNGTSTIGYDSKLGMLMSFGVGNASLRLGWTAAVAQVGQPGDNDYVAPVDANTSIGLGYTWWSGGEGLSTSISTNYDLTGTTTTDQGDGNLSMVVSFGF